MDDISAFALQHRSLTDAAIMIWMVVSISLGFILWTRPSKASTAWKVFWSLVLAVPILGWIAYLGLFRLTAQDRAGDTAPPRWSY
jgi:hypothetical protein